MKKTTVLFAFVLAFALCVPAVLSGCANSSASSASSTSTSQPEPPKATPGIVDMEHLQSGLKYAYETSSVSYADAVAAFGNEGSVYKDKDDKYITYSWQADDLKNQVLVTFKKKDDGSVGNVSGVSWSGDEIKAYKEENLS